jgi:hypothetical protein
MHAASPWVGGARWVLYVQACVYVVTGAWPLVHMASFEAATGPKYDDFLVHTVGLLLVVVGAAVLSGLRRAALTVELLWVSAGTAVALFAIDVGYWANGRLSAVYLIDAAAEATFASAALLLLRAGGSTAGR